MRDAACTVQCNAHLHYGCKPHSSMGTHSSMRHPGQQPCGPTLQPHAWPCLTCRMAADCQVVMSDGHTLALRLRAPLSGVTWLKLCWHPTCARVALNPAAPPRGSASEAYSFAETASASLSGLVLVGVEVPRAWERVVTLRFASRPGEPPSRSLYCEVMARYVLYCSCTACSSNFTAAVLA